MNEDPLAVARAQGIEAALQLLVGKPVLIHRAVTLVMLSFGEPRLAPTPRNPKREASDYALHTEARWRFLGPDGLLTGRRDLYYEAGTGKDTTCACN